jgi:hypothetical protein
VQCAIKKCENNENKKNGKKKNLQKNCLITDLGTILVDSQYNLTKTDLYAY